MIDPGKRKQLLLAALIPVCLLLVYAQTAAHDFVLFDDHDYIVNNLWVHQGLRASSVAWSFQPGGTEGSYWHPLTWLSLMLDYQLVGLAPSWYHMVNVLLHGITALLLFSALAGMTSATGSSFMVALLFALHPLNVESVAWAAERKAVLCGLFFVLAILLYARYVRRPSPGRYLLVSLVFVLGLMSKSLIAPLPAILVLLDVWPLGRCSGTVSGRTPLPRHSPLWLIVEKLPLFLLSCLSVGISLHSLRGVYLLDERNLLPLGHRIANAVVSYPRYLWKVVWPADLAVYYPVRLDIPLWHILLSSAVIALLSGAAIRWFKKFPWFFVGWFWFVVALVPVLGIVRRGLWPASADRFAYLAMIGALVSLVWGAGHLFEKHGVAAHTSRWCAVVLLALCSLLCHRQVSYWRDSGTLFQRAIAVTEDNDIALANLGWYRFSENREGEALALFRQMAAIDPCKPDYEYACGALEFRKQRYDSAARWFEKALKRNEAHLASLFFLGLAYERSGVMEQAAAVYAALDDTSGPDPNQYRRRGSYRLRTVVQPALCPSIAELSLRARQANSPELRRRHADSLYRAGLWQSARAAYMAITTPDSDGELLFRLAECDRRMGNGAEAERSLCALLASGKSRCRAAELLGRMYMRKGKWDDARWVFETVLDSGLDCPAAAYGRAYCLYATGRWREALTGFQGIRSGSAELLFKASRHISRLRSF